MGWSIRLSIYPVVSLVATGLAQTSDFQTCFRIDGSVDPDSIRCDNGTTGHSTCCSPGRVCWSNGVCQGPSYVAEDWLREGCTDHTWNDPACFDVCQWDTKVIGVRPCGGITQSNVYCCDDGSTGPGSFACCNNASSTFTYDNITSLPTIIATIPARGVVLETASTSSISSTTSTTSTIETSSPSSTGPAENESLSTSSNSSVGIGVGIGVGIPVAAAIIGGVWWIISRSKQKQSIPEKGSHELTPNNSSGFQSWEQQAQQQKQQSWSLAEPQETSGKEIHNPSELATSNEYSELSAVSPRFLRNS